MRKFQKYLFVGLIFCGGALQVTESRAEQAVANDVVLEHALSDESLGYQNGRQDTGIEQLNMSLADTKSTSRMDSNILSATGSTFNNGANAISQNAFSNASGMVTVIQNSGNQVLIQNDMVLNLFMK